MGLGGRANIPVSFTPWLLRPHSHRAPTRTPPGPCCSLRGEGGGGGHQEQSMPPAPATCALARTAPSPSRLGLSPRCPVLAAVARLCPPQFSPSLLPPQLHFVALFFVVFPWTPVIKDVLCPASPPALSCFAAPWTNLLQGFVCAPSVRVPSPAVS